MISLLSNLGLLGIFKYFNFFTESFSEMMLFFGWTVDPVTLNIILPVGISFYTFQTLSYTIDVYRKKIIPTKNIVSFFTFVSLFPQLVAGPIERASNLLPQIEQKRIFRYTWFKSGMFQIFVGLFRKIVIADNLAVYVDTIYKKSEIHNSSTLLLATFLYAFQIYYDFAGYSDIAIGSAKLLGFEFKRNFNFPYFTKSLTEFWHKWHISLSSWLRDYLYISLGGNRKGENNTYRNLILTMLIGGLWHGSSWNFVIWGGFHGIILSLERYIFKFKKVKHFGPLGYVYTFCIVLFSWIFFRSQNIKSAFTIIRKLFTLNYIMPFVNDINVTVVSISMLAIGIIFDLILFRNKTPLEDLGENFGIGVWIFALTFLIMIMCLFYSSTENFIYFQF